MLIAVQRVRSLRAHQEGTNIFRYRHSGLNMDFTALNIEDQILRNCGKLESYSTEIQPGGNSVLSYLDIAAPDSSNDKIIVNELRQLLDPNTLAPTFRRLGSLGLNIHARFWTTSTLDASLELPSLRDTAIAFLSNSIDKGQSSTDLEISVTYESERRIYQLTPTSIETLRSIKGDEWRPTRLIIPHTIASDYETVYGSLFSLVLDALIGLAPAEFRRIGSITFRDSSSNRIIRLLSPDGRLT